jgi:hypothetical protein
MSECFKAKTVATKGMVATKSQQTVKWAKMQTSQRVWALYRGLSPCGVEPGSGSPHRTAVDDRCLALKRTAGILMTGVRSSRPCAKLRQLALGCTIPPDCNLSPFRFGENDVTRGSIAAIHHQSIDPSTASPSKRIGKLRIQRKDADRIHCARPVGHRQSAKLRAAVVHGQGLVVAKPASRQQD